MNWAGSLTVGGFGGWRLPTTIQPDATCSIQDPFTFYSWGNGCTNSEMGHLFYTELSGTAGLSILTSGDSDLALFNNLQEDFYWSATVFAPVPTGSAWRFTFNTGLQAPGDKGLSPHAWAVRDGDVGQSPIPEPSTMLLFGSGLAGLAA